MLNLAGPLSKLSSVHVTEKLKFGKNDEDADYGYDAEKSLFMSSDPVEEEKLSASLQQLKEDNFLLSNKLEAERRANEAAALKIAMAEKLQHLKLNVLDHDFGNGVTGKSVLKAFTLMLQQRRRDIEAVQAENIAIEARNNKRLLGVIPKHRKKMLKRVPKEVVNIKEMKQTVFHPVQSHSVELAVRKLISLDVLDFRYEDVYVNNNKFPEEWMLKAISD